MKIVHIIDYFQPKLGYQETFLAREHTRMGHDVCVVTSDRYNPIVYTGDAARTVLGKRMVGSGFFIEEGIKVWRLKTLIEVPHAIWLRGLERKLHELQPELVIIHGTMNFSALRIAKLKRKLGNFKLVFDDHMTFENSTSRMRILYPLFKRMFSRIVIKAADAFVAVVPESKIFMHRRYGIPLERISIIPMGADDDLFHSDPNVRLEIRNQLSIKESDIVFIYTGKIIPEKRLPILIEAAGKLINHENCVKVLFVGSGSPTYIEELKRSIITKGFENYFIWHHAVQNYELPKFYTAADVAVWPKGSSIGQCEAIAIGLPLIISEGAASAQLLVSYNNGFIFHEEDISHLYQQMEKLLDPALRKEMGFRSRKLVEEHLSWKIIAKQFLDLTEK